MKILPRSEGPEISGGSPNYEKSQLSNTFPTMKKIPTMKILPRSESAEIGGGNPNYEKSQL
jgi:hypothetical protein